MEKAIWTVVSAAVLCLTATAAVQPGENILENGTFECDQLPFPWMWSTTTPAVCHGNVSGGPDGLPYLSIGGDAGSSDEVSARQYGLTLAEGARYRLSARVRTKGFASKNCGVMIINGGWKKCASAGPIPADTQGEWKLLSHEFTCFPSWNSNYTAVAYAVSAKGTLDVADMRLEALDAVALAHSAKPPRDETTTLPRLVPMTPLLWRIPSDERAVTFRFFGKLPQGTVADSDVRVKVGNEVVRVPLSLEEMRLPVPGTAMTGRMDVAVVTRATGAVVHEETFTFRVIERPVVDRTKHRRLNNLCAEILREDFAGGTSSWPFSAPRDGWLYVGIRGKSPFAATLDGRDVIATNDCPRSETFRHVSAGTHVLSVSGAGQADVIVRSIAEMFSYAPGVNGQVGREPRFDWAFSERYVLPALTTEDGGIIPESARAEFRRRGYWWMENYGTPATNVETLVRWLAARPGLTAPHYDGFAYDELFFSRPKQIDVFTRAVRAYDLECTPERILRGWTCGKPGSLGLDHAFMSAVVNASRGNGRLQTEVYGRTTATEEEARDFAREYVGGIVSGFRRFHPHAVPALSLIFGNFVEPGVISILHHPEVDPKRFLDVELNFAANDPLARDVGGVGWWACNHTDDEICRWSFMLLRHYVVEGRTGLLSERFGYAYRPDHLLNGDFRGAIAPWTAEGDVTVGYARGFAGASEGRFGIQSDIGDRYAVLTKTNGVAAAIRQTAKNLVPGRLYCLQFAAFDARDVAARRTAPRRFAIEAKLSTGAEIVPELSWVHVDKRQKGYYASNTGVARINVHHVVFRALKPEIDVTISAADAREGESLGINWLSLNPYFSREEQGEDWWTKEW